MPQPPTTLSKNKAETPGNSLHDLAFNNTSQATVITIAKSGKIILVNKAACKILGYSEKALLTKARPDIFDIKESSFKKMLRQRTESGKSEALVTAIKKTGKTFTCEITSAVFMDTDGIEKAVTTITDRSKSIKEQININKENERVVANNISIAISIQADIDVKKEKIVSENIQIAQTKSDIRLAENNEWIKYISKTSYDVMWDWNMSTGEIYVGDSVKEVFGYDVKDNTVDIADFTNKLLPGEKDSVEKKLWKIIKSDKRNWNDSFRIKRFDGSIANVIGRAGIVRDEKGKAFRLIGNIQDISKLRELESQLAEQHTILREQDNRSQIAAKLSYDGIWDWNIVEDEFILGAGFEELFGYTFNEEISFDWISHVHPDDRDVVEKSLAGAIESTAVTWEQTYQFIRSDGTIARVQGKATILREPDGKAYRMVGLVHDLSHENKCEEKLEEEIARKAKLLTEYEENFRLIFSSSSDVLYDMDLIHDKINPSLSFEKEYGYKIGSEMTPAEDWLRHIHPDDRDAVLKEYTEVIESEKTEWKCKYRFTLADKSVANISSSAKIQRSATGQACRMIISMHDISKQVLLEKRLEQEVQLKEEQIAEARETERSDIGKELHDNINQLLGASRLYLELAKRGGENSELYLSRSSEYTLMAIEEIRILTKGLTTDIVKELGLVDAIKNVSRDTMEINPIKIFCSFRYFKEKSVNEKFKLNIFRIVQEQLNNIVKHANSTEVIITLLQNKNNIRLGISDNGVGFDTKKSRNGIGINNIKSRVASFGGTADFITQPGRGCALNVAFPVTEKIISVTASRRSAN
ncbi:MAG: PAS domain-containing protein [Ferruginibacter sp.]